MWDVRAGDVIKLPGLVPDTVTAPSLDNLRTFYIRETIYNASRNTLSVTPDRPMLKLSNIIPRTVQVERDT